MDFKDWIKIYEDISKDFNFDLKKEKIAAKNLSEKLKCKNLYPIEKLKDLLFEKEVYIFGAGPSLENNIKKNLEKFQNKILISADGATSALIKFHIDPDIIVTDLDGRIEDQIKVNERGSIVLVHAHGDNIEMIDQYLSKFHGRIIGTIQIDPSIYENIYNFGGFTDGDRAIFLAEHFSAKKINLIGFDFDEKIGKYSFAEKKDKKLKFKKLKWCKNLIQMLNKKYQNIFFKI